MTIAGLSPAPVPAQPTPTPLTPVSGSASGGLSFGDVLDAVNPLQHIPIISGLFRAATGSQISSAAEVAGDTLYGALLPGGAIAGLASSLADVAVKQVTGSDISQTVVSALTPTAATPAPVATPLTPTAAAAAISSMPSVPHINLSHSTQTSNHQYQRVQAFDAINSKLVKMAV